VICFAYLAFLGFAFRSILKKQGIDVDAVQDEDLQPLGTEPEGALDVVEHKR
jgi:hypothetical protein